MATVSVRWPCLTQVVGPNNNMHTPTQADKNAALRAVTYDAAVLAMALHNLRTPRSNFLGRGTDQLAVESALLKFRSLYDFLTSSKKNRDDILIAELGGTAAPFPAPIERFRESVNKYSAHLTWQRVVKDPAIAEFPRPSKILERSPEVLQRSKAFIESCLTSGFELNSYGKKYLSVLRRYT